MNLGVPDLLMAYEHLVLFAALFDIPLMPEACHAHTCDADDGRLQLVDVQMGQTQHVPRF